MPDAPIGEPAAVVVVARERAARRLGESIARSPGLRLAGVFERLRDGICAVLADPPRLLLLELDASGGVDFVSALTNLHRERVGTEVIVVCEAEDPRLVSALRAGAVGHLDRRADAEAVGAAAREVVEGRAALAPSIVRRLLADLHALPPSPTPSPSAYAVSPREGQILAALVEGRSDGEIAAELRISSHTVRVHLRSIYRKLGVSSRAAAAARAVREGLV